MTRIEWTRLSGEETETVAAMFLYSEYPAAERIRPGQGDFGVDVLVPYANGLADIYQVKRFTELTSSNRSKIDESFRRLLAGIAVQKVLPRNWYLVIPVNSTLTDREWLQAAPSRALKRVKEELDAQAFARADAWVKGNPVLGWKGLTWLDTMASKYPFVVDYYLRDGKDRLRNAMADLVAVFGLQRDDSQPTASLVEPSEIVPRLDEIRGVLDTDPHFRYGVSIDPKAPALDSPDPDLIAATQEIRPDGWTITFKIYARFREALRERPIPIRVRFKLEEGTPDHTNLQRWLKFGGDLTLPADVEFQLPGGLGGPLKGGTVRIGEAASAAFARRYRVVNAQGGVVADPVTITSVSTLGASGTGIATEGADSSGHLRFRSSFDADSQAGNIAFSLEDLPGSEASAVRSAVEFLHALTPPNRVQIAEAYGPFIDAFPAPDNQGDLDPLLLELTRLLDHLQELTPVPLRLPLADERIALDPLREAADLIRGEVVKVPWSKPFYFDRTAAGQLDPGEYEVRIYESASVRVASEVLQLGVAEVLLRPAKLVPASDRKVIVEPVPGSAGYKRLIDPTDHSIDADEVSARLVTPSE